MSKYKVNITYFNTKFNGRAYKAGLTLEEAQEICSDKESSWNTCTKSHLKRRTREKGIWFLTYTEQ